MAGEAPELKVAAGLAGPDRIAATPEQMRPVAELGGRAASLVFELTKESNHFETAPTNIVQEPRFRRGDQPLPEDNPQVQAASGNRETYNKRLIASREIRADEPISPDEQRVLLYLLREISEVGPTTPSGEGRPFPQQEATELLTGYQRYTRVSYRDGQAQAHDVSYEEWQNQVNKMAQEMAAKQKLEWDELSFEEKQRLRLEVDKGDYYFFIPKDEATPPKSRPPEETAKPAERINVPELYRQTLAGTVDAIKGIRTELEAKREILKALGEGEEKAKERQVLELGIEKLASEEVALEAVLPVLIAHHELITGADEEIAGAIRTIVLFEGLSQLPEGLRNRILTGGPAWETIEAGLRPTVNETMGILAARLHCDPGTRVAAERGEINFSNVVESRAVNIARAWQGEDQQTIKQAINELTKEATAKHITEAEADMAEALGKTTIAKELGERKQKRSINKNALYTSIFGSEPKVPPKTPKEQAAAMTQEIMGRKQIINEALDLIYNENKLKDFLEKAKKFAKGATKGGLLGILILLYISIGLSHTGVGRGGGEEQPPA